MGSCVFIVQYRLSMILRSPHNRAMKGCHSSGVQRFLASLAGILYRRTFVPFATGSVPRRHLNAPRAARSQQTSITQTITLNVGAMRGPAKERKRLS